MDGRAIGRGTTLAWFPFPGRHRLELRDDTGRTIDTVRFAVRGASAIARPNSPPRP
jgi:penicillin-binding protein 1C